MVLIDLYIAGPTTNTQNFRSFKKKIQVPKGQIVSTKLLIVLKTSGLSKRLITNPGSKGQIVFTKILIILQTSGPSKDS